MSQSPIIDNTPVMPYVLNGRTILVKREDLCSPAPGPGFSKTRGVWAHIQNRPERVIGVLDTLHSKAGWCVGQLGAALGRKVVNYWPRYKSDPQDGLPRVQQRHSASFGSEMVALQAGRSFLLYHKAKRDLMERFGPDAYMMPNALKLPESVTENAAETIRTLPHLPDRFNLLVSISSGTVAAGVLRGLGTAGVLDRVTVWLHSGYDRPDGAVREYVSEKAQLSAHGIRNVRIIREGYNYADAAPAAASAPFPCNPYYDLKAWHWLSQNTHLMDEHPVVFWNIGW